jgi:hypothetical protein
MKDISTGKDKNNQKEKFIETARALGCDESEEAFNAKLKAIASVNTAEKPAAKKKP